MATKQEERAVLVTTEYRGVFFGYANKTGGMPVTGFRLSEGA